MGVGPALEANGGASSDDGPGSELTIAFLILAHANPDHLARLTRRLASAHTHVHVHIDAKVDERLFDASRTDAVSFCKRRTRCAWGNISLVDATLDLIDDALSAPPRDYYALLSGNCYPLRSIDYIRSFLARNRGKEFIQAYGFPDVAYGKKIDRLTRYFIKRDWPARGLKEGIQSLIQSVVPPRDYRRVFDGMELVAGAQWWCLTRAALLHVREVVASNRRLYAFCRHIDCPDEFLFQLILWNSPFRPRISHCLTYTDWPPGGSGPKTLDVADLPALEARPILDSPRNNCPQEKREVVFARKFADDPGLVDAIDRNEHTT